MPLKPSRFCYPLSLKRMPRLPGPNDHSVSDMIEASKQMYKERAKGPSTNGKGDKRRPGKVQNYLDNYERIYSKERSLRKP